MRTKVILKFSSEEREHLDSVSKQVQLSYEEFCKRCVIWAINEAYRRSAEEESSDGNNSVSPGAEGIQPEVQPVTNSNALSNTDNVSVNPE